MRPDLDRSLDLILGHEGEWSNNPNDRGGPTLYGIIQPTLDAARVRFPRLPRSVRDLSVDDARLIYREGFWFPSLAHLLPWPVCYAQMDAAVQHAAVFAPRRAVKWLQYGVAGTKAIEAGVLKVDGVPGPKTLKAIDSVTDWTRPLARMLMHRAILYIRILKSPSQGTFADGWANRLRDVAQLCDRELPERRAAA